MKTTAPFWAALGFALFSLSAAAAPRAAEDPDDPVEVTPDTHTVPSLRHAAPHKKSVDPLAPAGARHGASAHGAKSGAQHNVRHGAAKPGAKHGKAVAAHGSKGAAHHPGAKAKVKNPGKAPAIHAHNSHGGHGSPKAPGNKHGAPHKAGAAKHRAGHP